MTSNNQRTSREELTNCATCGQMFKRMIVKASDGKEYGFTRKLCDVCEAKKSAEERKQEAKEQLEKVIKKQRASWYEKYGVDGIFGDKTFDNFDKNEQLKAFEKLSNYKTSEGGSFILSSPGIYGVGKTHLVCALANKIVAETEPAMITGDGSIFTKSCYVHFSNESRLLARIRQTYSNKDGESEEDIYNSLNLFSLLIIDDVGKVRPRDYSFLQGVYFRIIDDRYVRAKDIILTTNLDFKELEEHIGGACADRLREMCGKDGFIKMAGQSYRRKEQKQ